MSNVKASVILTSYNKPKYLKRAIESCLAQDYPNLEIIIADDNSPNPDVWNVINSYSDKRIISFNSLLFICYIIIIKLSGLYYLFCYLFVL